MKAYTKYIKEQFKADRKRVSCGNNSKTEQRTLEQNIQAHRDKKNFYIRKWNNLLEDSTTPTQKDYCKRIVLSVDSKQVENSNDSKDSKGNKSR